MEMEDGMARLSTLTAMSTAEMVTDGHPDKFCDQVADAILDEALKQDANTRAGIECLAKDNLVIVSGELSTRANLKVEEIARQVWESVVGYGPGEELTVISHIKLQSAEIARGGDHDEANGVDSGGAGDQGVMVGYATHFQPRDEAIPKLPSQEWHPPGAEPLA
jgi:S-adenosylmethionine synthetase